MKDLRVLDVSAGVAGPLAAKLLADAGACVTRVALTEHANSAFTPDGTLAEQFGNLDKTVLRVDRTTATGLAEIERLLDECDLYLTSFPHHDRITPTLTCEGARVRHPELLTACVTPFGQSGPYSDFRADDVVLAALSGLADATPGFPDRQEHESDPPVQSWAPVSEMAAGIIAAVALFGAVFARVSGAAAPKHVEVSSLEAAVALMVWEWGITAYGGGVRGRRPGHADPEPNCYVRCRDGHAIIVAIRENHWNALVEMMGNPPWASEPSYRDQKARTANWKALHARIREWTMGMTREEILESAQRMGIPCCPGFELRETLASDHIRESRSVRIVGGRTFPADPLVVNGERRAPESRGSTENEPASAFFAQSTDRGDESEVSSPLAGVRVLDLTQYVAGPFAGQLLGALGAEVLFVETSARLGSRSIPPFVGEPTFDASANFNQINRGKKSISLDLSTRLGQRTLRKLVSSCDVVLENFSRRAAHKLGLTYPDLAKERSDVVVVSISAFGRTGPWGGYVALHSGVILLSGLASVTQDDQGRPRLIGSIYPDLLAGAYCALAAQEALVARERDGEGGHIEVSMLDVLLTCMGGLVPVADRPQIYTPHPSSFLRVDGENRFVAVSDPNDLPVDAGEMACLTREEAMTTLQREGVAAGAVLDMADVMGDPHLNSRGFVARDDHPVAGDRPIPAVPWTYDSRRPSLGHAPTLGANTDDVLRRFGGVDSAELAELREAGVLT